MRGTALSTAALILSVVPLFASEPDAVFATCHLTYFWRNPHPQAALGLTHTKDYRIKTSDISKLPLFSELKISAPQTVEMATPDFKGEIKDETDKDVIVYTGTFTHAFDRDTFSLRESSFVVLPPIMPSIWTGGVLPSSSPFPQTLNCYWRILSSSSESASAQRSEYFAVAAQVCDRHSRWTHAHFTGTCTIKSKSWFGGVVTKSLNDADIIFQTGDQGVTDQDIITFPIRT